MVGAAVGAAAGVPAYRASRIDPAVVGTREISDL